MIDINDSEYAELKRALQAGSIYGDKQHLLDSPPLRAESLETTLRYKTYGKRISKITFFKNRLTNKNKKSENRKRKQAIKIELINDLNFWKGDKI